MYIYIYILCTYIYISGIVISNNDTAHQDVFHGDLFSIPFDTSDKRRILNSVISYYSAIW